MAKTNLKISIIIPTLNEEKYISGILTDLENQTYKPTEIIIVDGQSQDQTQKVVLSFRHIRIIQSHPPVGYQRKEGGYKAQGDILIFFDADVRVQSNFIEETVAQCHQRNLEIACPLYISQHGLLTQIFLGMLNVLFILLQKFIPSGGGNCIIVSRAAFIKSGGFDPDVQFDDIEFIRRVSHNHTFGIITTKCSISDRRFRKYGFLKTLGQYLILSFFFTFGLFKKTDRFVHYEFGKFDS